MSDKPRDLYDVAREVSHSFGMPWYDPRTGKRYDPPSDDPAIATELWMKEVFARQGAVHKHAQDLTCPECGSHQNQIMNLSSQGEPFAWRCRMCGHRFVSGRP